MSTLTDLTARLLQILRDEDGAHGALVDSARQLNDAIKCSDLDGISRYSGLYDAHIAQVEQLEERRLAVCDELTEAVGFEKRHLNLATLIGTLPIEHRPPLVELRASLREKIRVLTRLNTSNRILLEASLGAVAKGVEIKVKAQRRVDGYGKSGAKTSKPIARSTVKYTA